VCLDLMLRQLQEFCYSRHGTSAVLRSTSLLQTFREGQEIRVDPTRPIRRLSCRKTAITSLMSTFVLVHGAWQGASTWDLVVPKLQTVGHKVFTPILRGLGADSPRLSPAIDLDSHIDDVADVLKREKWQ
jgi:pimeloyl-ACP methyl ester carboxylesterase